MEERRTLRNVRIVISATCMTLFLVCVLLWASSYFMLMLLARDNGLREVAVASSPGEVHLLVHVRSQAAIPRWEYGIERITANWKNPLVDNGQAGSATLGFRWISGRESSRVSIPYWLLTVLGGVCAAAPWAPWSRRFSLRSLLIATTLVAVLWGMVVAFS
jgi:hypothetical protein